MKNTLCCCSIDKENIFKTFPNLMRSKYFSVEAGWILLSLLHVCCRFDCIDKGQVTENFAEESAVSY
jgi:hypothetical protein